ncbi:hypothetical protein GOBAR_AA21980 [Gossypium barbadense]|uniref:Transposase MuDR plant domain-containing protein n=1 Tax=Gossypium barbadense TaxID=3634 RepID=A0A2P5X5S7_GOSBA|nr:hypothetical protein GOBAR_AA21980 [Gossypium barbadense]
MLMLTTGESDAERVETDWESDIERVEADRDGVVEEVQANGEGDVEGVEAYGKGVTTTNIEADEYGDGVDNVVVAISGEEEDGNDTKAEVWDLDEHGSLLGLGMLFKDKCRRQRKFLKNEPKRVVRILASYSPIAKYLQVKTFQEEYHCLVSFKNKMVTATMIAQHFETTINDHPKMKLRKFQKCASEMHVNVGIYCCYRAKKEVKENMASNYEEFGQLYDYTHESRLKCQATQ